MNNTKKAANAAFLFVVIGQNDNLYAHIALSYNFAILTRCDANSCNKKS